MPNTEPCHCVLCSPDGEPHDRVVENVLEFGWHVVLVPADDESVGWAFTVGLWHHHRLPELTIFGLEVPEMHQRLNELAAAAVAGQTLADTRRVDYRWYAAYFGTAIGFYRRPPFPIDQVVRAVAVPSDDQPALWLQPSDHPPGVWTAQL